MTLLDKITAYFNTRTLISALTAIIILSSACKGEIEDPPPAAINESQPTTQVKTEPKINSRASTATAIPKKSGPSTSIVKSSPNNSPTLTNPTSTTVPLLIKAPLERYIPVPPDRDLSELARRLIKDYVEPEKILAPQTLTLGQKVSFWILRDGGNTKVSGEVSYISEHAYWIFENGFIPNTDDIEKVAESFENNIWPVVTEVFGSPVTPGIDADERMVIYNGILQSGMGGYFSAADSYSNKIRKHSNERQALYMSANQLALTSRQYLSVLAHELQHATHFASDSSEDSWVNEGLSEIAAEIAGFDRTAISTFILTPSTSLIAFDTSPANYGAANLFFAFLATHYGGTKILSAVSQNQQDGMDSIDSVLADLGFDVRGEDVYADWLIANYLNSKEGPYSYKSHSLPSIKKTSTKVPAVLDGEVKSFGSDYVVTSSESEQITIEFKGELETALLTHPPHSGETCWWSNQGDSIDSTLTRHVDLSDVDTATLSYWVNYDIEESWDYVYTMVSTDEGATWDILTSERSTDLNPNGNSYGPGLTGNSMGWVQDSADISKYAGQEVLIRFEYITDDALFAKGICLDDFEISEINWNDNTSTTGGWIPKGFTSVETTIPTDYLIQVIHEKSSGDSVVYRIPVDNEGNGTIKLDHIDKDDLVITIVSAVTRQSTTPTDYTLTISR